MNSVDFGFKTQPILPQNKVVQQVENSLLSITDQVKIQYGWKLEYAKKVAFEYERFLKLRSINDNLSPSDDIDKFWHQHILNTASYFTYCFSQFGKIVHHNPTDSYDQNQRLKRYDQTLKQYIKHYGDKMYPDVWTIIVPKKVEIVVPNKISTDPPVWPIFPMVLNRKNYPQLEVSVPNITPLGIKIKTYSIKATIFYTFDNGNGHRTWKKNNKIYDGKTLTYHYLCHQTLKDLKLVISEKTGHHDAAIRIYPENQKSIIYVPNTGGLIDLNDDILLFNISQKSINLIAVLEEMTQNGYC